MSSLFAPAQPITFTVYGSPRPQGSTRAFIPKGWTRPIITTDNTNLKPWRQQISGAAAALNAHQFAKGVPLSMSLAFYFTKPASVPKSRIYPTVKPDTDKLIRAILDSLTGILFHDDAQIVRFEHVEKHYGAPERVVIQLQAIGF